TAGNKAPGRRRTRGEQTRLARRNPVTREGTRGCRLQGRVAPARPREGGDRDRGEQLAPTLPVDELRQDVGAHQPDEMGMREGTRRSRPKAHGRSVPLPRTMFL